MSLQRQSSKIIRVGPNLMWQWPYKRKRNLDTGRKPWKDEARDWGDHSASQRMPVNSQKQEKTRDYILLHSPQQEPALRTDTVQTYILQNYETINFLFKPPISGNPGKPMHKRIHILVASLSKIGTETKLNVASPKIKSVQ